MTKFTFISKIHSNQSINCLLREEKKVGLNTLKYSMHSQTFDYVYDNLEDYNPTKRRLLIMFDDMIAAMAANKN